MDIQQLTAVQKYNLYLECFEQGQRLRDSEMFESSPSPEFDLDL